MDTEGATESVHINGLSMLSGLKLGECKSFFPVQGKNKLFVILRCLTSRVMGQVSSNLFHLLPVTAVLIST